MPPYKKDLSICGGVSETILCRYPGTSVLETSSINILLVCECVVFFFNSLVKSYSEKKLVFYSTLPSEKVLKSQYCFFFKKPQSMVVSSCL